MRKITSALALVGALGLFAACGDAQKGDTAPESPDAPEITETVDGDMPTKEEVVDAIEDIDADNGAAAGDMDPAAFQTVELSISGMT